MSDVDPRRVSNVAVWRRTERVGAIVRTRSGAVFEYGDAFLAARPRGEDGIAFRLPYARRRFETAGVNLHPYFAGLLPEGLRLRAVARLAKTSEDDLLSLLVAAGGDTVGDVSVSADGEPPRDATPDADVERTDEVLFSELFAQSVGAPAAGGSGWSVAGVQPKVSAARVSFPVRARKGEVPSILKLGTAEHPRLVENEAFFVAAARDCGLDTPQFRVVHDRDGNAGLLVARFDRVARRRGEPPLRVHQEDACQLLDRYPADKYRLSLREIADGLAEIATAPILAVAWLVRIQAFSYAIANGDLHAKNVSVRRDPMSGRVTPTPAYDLLSTLPYGDDRMALSMEGRDRNLRRRDFIAFGGRHGVRPAAVAAILDEVVEGLAPWVARIAEIGFDAKQTKDLQKTVATRLDRLR